MPHDTNRIPNPEIKLTHLVFQIAPDGTPTECRFYSGTDASVAQWMRDMRRDNPDYRYIPGHVL